MSYNNRVNYTIKDFNSAIKDYELKISGNLEGVIFSKASHVLSCDNASIVWVGKIFFEKNRETKTAKKNRRRKMKERER